jgi:hypothetical protein
VSHGAGLQLIDSRNGITVERAESGELTNHGEHFGAEALQRWAFGCETINVCAPGNPNLRLVIPLGADYDNIVVDGHK